MIYKNTSCYWHNYPGVSILTDKQGKGYGYIKPVGNQIHLEYIRQLRNEARVKL